MADLRCSICGGADFRENKVLPSDLVAEWQLSSVERAYIDRQQGCACKACGANLRIIALGTAILQIVESTLSLRDTIASGALDPWRVLDCNGAEGISKELSILKHYFRADYPEYDMRALPFPDSSFDLVIHSDTLEHVEHPVLALEECRRVLSPVGRLCFTVPMIIGRLTRGRAGLPPSFHGDPAVDRDDYVVHTEFGTDSWTILMEAGFSNVTLSQVEYPCAIAFTAWNADENTTG